MLLVILAAAFVFGIRHFANVPFSDSEESVTVEILQGTGLNKTAQILEESGLIKSSLVFKSSAVLERLDKTIKAGEYEFKKNMTPSEILSILSEGKVKLYKIVIPEGYTVLQITDLIDASGVTTRKAFLEAATDKDFIKELGIKTDSIEGYLFPETYLFPKKTSPKKIIKTMTSGLFKIFTPEAIKRSRELKLTVHQIITLASIIEKETGSAGERPLISSVFHNRLRLGMRLETDPAVIYGINDFDGNITKKDLQTPGPYNTYLIPGLPPGPIACPGEASIKAALYPAETKYLYFVSKNDSTHFFSTNYRDHQNAVRLYQLKRKQD